MGEVYLAVDQRLGSAVALKRTFFAGDATLGSAFEREARTLARMRHPVLPKVSDHFGENDEQYLVMEHISGDDLAKRLESAQKPFPVSWVLFWADQLLDALSYLHTHEPPIIHRDIKPQNLKLTDENHIILLDFGLSKTSTGQTNISQSGSTGSVVGYTPHYAPMEQIRGIGTSAKSDLYSLAATLYQLMTNKIPVDALSRADSMLNEMPDPIKPPIELNPEIPKSVSDVILKAMEVSQERRYSDAREMQRVLRKAFNDMQTATTAKTIAFTVNENRTSAIDQPELGLAASNDGQKAPKVDSEPELETAAPAAIRPDEQIDLDATMAYDTPFPITSSKQADVKTEVFLAGENSLALPEKQSYEAAPPVTTEPPPWPQDDLGTPDAKPAVPDSSPAEFSPDATVPLISIPGDAGGSSEKADSLPGPAAGSVSSSETFSTPSTPYFGEAESVPEDRSNPAQHAAAAAAAPAERKSSKKIFVLLGGLFALFLLGVVVAGGVWAYMNFGAGQAVTDPTPTPSPEASLEITPSPEITPESVFDSNNSNGSNSGNTSNSNDEVETASPTPFSTPGTSSTPTTTRPTPQGTPRVTPTRPVATPRDKPTPQPRKTPVVRPTILQ